MSMPVLIQVYDETRRLAIAGSAVAPGDFRLKKLIAPLEKSGEKAPVFTKVAQAVTAVVESTEKTASMALLELATLVNAILYTQGQTGVAGELKPLESVNLGGEATAASARILKPLLEALTSTGSGRIELVRDAIERGIFRDLRLVMPAVNALDDPYPEIADLIAQKVLPLYGKAIVPQLRARLDLKGRGGHLLRLQLLHQIDPPGSRELVQQALREGSKEIKVAAIECLGTSDEDLAYLLDQSKAKAKDVRAAALRALSAAAINASEAVTTLKKAIAGPDLELMITRVWEIESPEIRSYVLQLAENQLAETLACKDPKQQGPAVQRLQQLCLCLRNRTDAPAEAFLLSCFEKAKALAAIKSEPSGADVNELVANLLACGTGKMRRELIAAQASLSGGMLSAAMLAARTTLEPAKFFAEFSPMLNDAPEKRSRKSGGPADRANALHEVLMMEQLSPFFFVRHLSMLGHRFQPMEATSLPPLDPRWLDAAVAAKSLDLVCKLARPDHAGVNQFLLEKLKEMKKPHESHHVLYTMVQIRHPSAVEAIIDSMKRHVKESTYGYVNYWFGRMIVDLPRSALPQLEAFLATAPEKIVDQLMDSVLTLKSKPE